MVYPSRRSGLTSRSNRTQTTLLLIHAGYPYVPYRSLESAIELNKEAYYLAMRHTPGAMRAMSKALPQLLRFMIEVDSIGPVRQRTMLSRSARFAERAASRRAQYPAIQDAQLGYRGKRAPQRQLPFSEMRVMVCSEKQV